MEHTDKFYKLMYKDGFVEAYGKKFTYKDTTKYRRKTITKYFDAFAQENNICKTIDFTDGLTGVYLGSVDMKRAEGISDEELFKYMGLLFDDDSVRRKRKMFLEKYGASPLYNNDKEES